MLSTVVLEKFMVMQHIWRDTDLKLKLKYV